MTEALCRACRLLDVSLAMVTLIDADAQWFKSRQGMGDRENPRTVRPVLAA